MGSTGRTGVEYMNSSELFPEIPFESEIFFNTNSLDTNILLQDPFFNVSHQDLNLSDTMKNGESINTAQNVPQNLFSGENVLNSFDNKFDVMGNNVQGQVDYTNIPSVHQPGAGQPLQNSVLHNTTDFSGLDVYGNLPALTAPSENGSLSMRPSENISGFPAVLGRSSSISQMPFLGPDYTNSMYPMYSGRSGFPNFTKKSTECIPQNRTRQNSFVTRPQQLDSAGVHKPCQNKSLYDTLYPELNNIHGETTLGYKLDQGVGIFENNRGKCADRSLSSPSEQSEDYNRSSSDISPGAPTKLSVLRAGEKPKRCDEKSWVRINNATKGDSTRTARINHFSENGTKYKIRSLPYNHWQSRNFEFDYRRQNGMDEFKKGAMPVQQILEYITRYPGDNLRLWIQVTPGDSARRYASKSHSECVFENCPNHVWARKGTIEVGNYRVAFDEKHKKYGMGVVDPFDCVGYAHLYCMERFLDFPAICQRADVRVDTRRGMKKEPKGEGSFTFGKRRALEKILAEKFIRAAKVGQLHRTPEFANYPIHAQYPTGNPKPHERTLTYAMFKANWDHRPPSQLKQFVSREIKPTLCGIHRGDQEIIVVDKKIKCLKEFKRMKRANNYQDIDYSRFYDRFNPEIKIRMTECLELRARIEREHAVGTSRRNSKSKKRKSRIYESSDSDEAGRDHYDDYDGDEEEEIFGRRRSQQLNVLDRSNPQKKQRMKCSEKQDDVQKAENQLSTVTGRMPMPRNWGYSTNPRHSISAQTDENFALQDTGNGTLSTSFEPQNSFLELPGQSFNLTDIGAFTDDELDRMLNYDGTNQAC